MVSLLPLSLRNNQRQRAASLLLQYLPHEIEITPPPTQVESVEAGRADVHVPRWPHCLDREWRIEGTRNREMVAIQVLAAAFVVVVFILSVTSFFRGGESGLQRPSPGSANLLGSLVDIHAHRKPPPPCSAHSLGGHHST